MSQKPKDKVMRVEIHTMAGSPLVLENVSAFNVLLSDGGWLASCLGIPTWLQPLWTARRATP